MLESAWFTPNSTPTSTSPSTSTSTSLSTSTSTLTSTSTPTPFRFLLPPFLSFHCILCSKQLDDIDSARRIFVFEESQNDDESLILFKMTKCSRLTWFFLMNLDHILFIAINSMQLTAVHALAFFGRNSESQRHLHFPDKLLSYIFQSKYHQIRYQIRYQIALKIYYFIQQSYKPMRLRNSISPQRRNLNARLPMQRQEWQIDSDGINNNDAVRGTLRSMNQLRIRMLVGDADERKWISTYYGQRFSITIPDSIHSFDSIRFDSLWFDSIRFDSIRFSETRHSNVSAQGINGAMSLVWEAHAKGARCLNDPVDAVELCNGDLLCCDDCFEFWAAKPSFVTLFLFG
jgi:hypothetical protein